MNIKFLPSTQKIKREEETKDYTQIKSIRIARNEKQSFQVILNSEKNVSCVDIKVTSSNKNIVKYIKINWQKYIFAKRNDEYYPSGMYPDAIVDFQLIKNKHENYLDSHLNQGINFLVDFGDRFVGKNIVNIEFIIDDISYDYKFVVEVLPYSLPKKNHVWTAFDIWGCGYFFEDMISENYKNAKDGFKKIYNLLKDYHISGTNPPIFDLDNIAMVIKQLKTYCKDDKIACYSLPYKLGEKNAYNLPDLDMEYLEKILYACVMNSSKDMDILSKAYLYAVVLDEPQYNNSMEYVKITCKKMREIIDRIHSKVKEQTTIFTDCPQIEQSLLRFQNVVTCDYNPVYFNIVDTFCHTVDVFGQQDKVEEIESRRNQGVQFWLYTCNQPVPPYSTYHINDDLLSSRILGWIQKKIKANGNLYFCVNITKAHNGQKYIRRDQWNDAYSMPDCAGDGFLVYSGARYGIDEPIPTIRLESIRDGNQDYEYLYLLDKNMNECERSSFLNPIYDNIIMGVVPTKDITKFIAARTAIQDKLLEIYQKKGALLE